jgi:uncharacterized protein YndB with AHSA1/START domain
MRISKLFIWAGVAIAAPAHSAVTATSEIGFATESSVEIAAAPDAIYALLVKPGLWWNDSHSYSGNAANMTIDPRAGGCFCEMIPAKTGPEGTVEHARVIYAQPGRLLRLSGALGPLQTEGVAATLDFVLAPAGQGTKVTLTYVVGGYVRGGSAEMAPLVDQVLAEQLAALKKAAESATP